MKYSQSTEHLGKVLHMLADLSPAYSCESLELARMFYESETGDIIFPSGMGYYVLEYKMRAFDEDFDERLMP
jgi:hypothetical protein